MTERFHHRLSDGFDVSLPYSIPFRVIRKLDEAKSDTAAMLLILDAVADDATLAHLDDADGLEVAHLFAAYQREYQERAEASLGESSRSVS